MPDPLRPTAAEALGAWALRVRSNREQAERFREGAPPRDFYAPVASNFRADPRRTDEPALDVLRSLARPGETWLDIGAGGGRYALPLALRVKDVIAVEPSEGMRRVLQAGMTEHGIANVNVVGERWPMEAPPGADVALMAHIGYDVEDIGSFLDTMEATARRLCVAVLMAPSPPHLARVPLPALPEFLVVLGARGRLFEVRLLDREPVTYGDRDAPLPWLYQQLFVAPDTEKGQRLASLAREAIAARGERWALSWAPGALGIATWRPR
jgi:SAM-dependent methyltransferase